MKSLLFYSGGQKNGNSELHRMLVAMAASERRGAERRKALTMTYVPFCTEGSRTFFYRAIKRYAPYGVMNFLCLDPEQNPTSGDIREALKSDIVYLAGGNTFFFLHQLKRLKMLPPLRDYVKKGGVLAGLSAGALIMTPNINLAGVPGLDPDENDVGLRNSSGLGLVPFEFSPHFVPNQKTIRTLLNYSKRTHRSIYASQDGGGIVVEGRRMSFVGRTWVFSRGTVFRIV
jgi:dipeptidase E